jgi:surfactin synthase thioesterase subunit
VDVLTARLPGREARMDEPLPTGLRTLAAEMAQEVGELFTGRLAVFGHSMGALLAFEFVRELRRVTGREPECLIVSGMPAPDLLAASMRYAELSDAELLAEVLAMGTSAPVTPQDLELWELLLPTLRSELRLCDEYEYRPAEPLTCPLMTYGSHADRDLDEELLAGWQRHTSGPFDLSMFPGDHFYFQHSPEDFAVDLVTRLRQHLLA